MGAHVPRVGESLDARQVGVRQVGEGPVGLDGSVDGCDLIVHSPSGAAPIAALLAGQTCRRSEMDLDPCVRGPFLGHVSAGLGRASAERLAVELGYPNGC